MSYPLSDLTGIGGAVIGDLEMTITDMDKEISYLTKELERAERFKAEYDKLSELWRDHLDEAGIEDDNEWEKEARQILWNDSDAEKSIEAEGYDRSECEPVPF